VAGPIRLLIVGRDRAGPYRDLAEDYLRRIAPFAPCTREVLPPSGKRSAAERRRDEARRMAARLDRRGVTVALGLPGESLSSAAFARRLRSWRERGGVTFLIGGPDGLERSLLERSEAMLALGPMTLPHELAAVVLLEQIYRALAAERGHPYADH